MGSEAQGKRPHPQLRPTRSLPRTTSNPPAACQRHRAMRRGFGCNLILNHIHCHNQIDTHNPKKTQIQTKSERRGADHKGRLSNRPDDETIGAEEHLSPSLNTAHNNEIYTTTMKQNRIRTFGRSPRWRRTSSSDHNLWIQNRLSDRLGSPRGRLRELVKKTKRWAVRK